MDGLSIFIAVVVIGIIVAIIYKYGAIERAMFGGDDPDFVSVGSGTMKLCVLCGAIMGIASVVGGMITDKAPIAQGFSSTWGIVTNGAAITAFASIAVSIYKVFMAETSAGRIAGRTAWVVVACLIGLGGGFAGSVIALVVLALLAILSAFLKTSLMPKMPSGGSSREGDYDATTTDEMGFERKLRNNGPGSYRDDQGRSWRDAGGGRVERDD